MAHRANGRPLTLSACRMCYVSVKWSKKDADKNRRSASILVDK